MSALEQAPGIRWWLNTDQVQGYVHGVFEGGGAKGVCMRVRSKRF